MSCISHFVIPDCDYRRFEQIALANPHSFEMNLIEGQLEMSPVSFETGALPFTSILRY